RRAHHRPGPAAHHAGHPARHAELCAERALVRGLRAAADRDRAVRARRHRPHSAQEVLMARLATALAAVPLTLTLAVSPAYAGPALAGPALAGPALAGPALASTALASTAVAGPTLAGPAVAGHYTGTLADGATWIAD